MKSYLVLSYDPTPVPNIGGAALAMCNLLEALAQGGLLGALAEGILSEGNWAGANPFAALQQEGQQGGFLFHLVEGRR